jgi:hypothetical protein
VILDCLFQFFTYAVETRATRRECSTLDPPKAYHTSPGLRTAVNGTAPVEGTTSSPREIRGIGSVVYLVRTTV